jgi:glycosyltransferase involved in cell wall biosynthesis
MVISMSDVRVSVIIPVYNCQNHIVSAVYSILNQTFTDFEVVIIDDGSTDGTINLLRQIKDSRVRVYSRSNKGLSETLRELVERSNGEYIARMDADDLSLPYRLELQTSILDKSPSTVLVSSNVTYIDENDEVLGNSISLTSKAMIRKAMFRGNIIFHPSVMFRRKEYYKSGGYDPYISKYCEDYLLWIEMLKIGDIHVMQDSLLKYRVHGDSISSNSPTGLTKFTQCISDNKGSYPDIIKDYDNMLSTPIKKNDNRKHGYKCPLLFISLLTLVKNIYYRFV